nr:protein YgfX [Pseudomonas aromaticivorans]
MLALYLAALGLALLALATAAVPGWVRAAGVVLCLVHAAWTLPRAVLLTHPAAFTGLRHDRQGWQLRNAAGGWVAVQLLPGSLALPQAVILQFRRPGQWFARGLCIPADSLERDWHRRLRVRLKFSRRRWSAVDEGAGDQLGK